MHSGAPQEMFVPNLFAVTRVLAFSVAVVVVPGVAVATGRTKPGPMLLGGLCLAAGLVLFASPATDGSFLSLGSQEPLLVGATIPGVALLAWSTGKLLRNAGPRWLIAAGLAGGFLLWSFGIIYKEASLVLLAGAPFLYLHLDRRWRESNLIQGRFGVSAHSFVTAAMMVPVAARRDRNDFRSGRGGLLRSGRAIVARGLAQAIRRRRRCRLGHLGGAGADRMASHPPLLVVMAAAVAMYRKRIPWLAVGWVTGTAAIVFQGLLLSPQPRYLIPGIALFAIAGVFLLADLPPWVGWGAVIAALALTAWNFREVRDSADLYAEWQEGEGQVIKSVAEVHPETCPSI